MDMANSFAYGLECKWEGIVARAQGHCIGATWGQGFGDGLLVCGRADKRFGKTCRGEVMAWGRPRELFCISIVGRFGAG